MVKPLFLLSVLLCGMLPGSLLAQKTAPSNRFQEKRVALYVSKKNFQFSEAYNILFSGLLQRNDTLGLSETDIRTGTTIKLGTLMTQVLNDKMRAYGSYFVNGVPGLAQAFVGSSEAGQFDYNAVHGAVPEGTDYVLIVDNIWMGTTVRVSTFAYSNQLFTERRKVKLARLHAELYDVRSRRKVRDVVLNYDDDKAPMARAYFVADASTPPAQTFLYRLFNTLFADLNQLEN